MPAQTETCADAIARLTTERDTLKAQLDTLRSAAQVVLAAIQKSPVRGRGMCPLCESPRFCECTLELRAALAAGGIVERPCACGCKGRSHSNFGCTCPVDGALCDT